MYFSKEHYNKGIFKRSTVEVRSEFERNVYLEMDYTPKAMIQNIMEFDVGYDTDSYEEYNKLLEDYNGNVPLHILHKFVEDHLEEILSVTENPENGFDRKYIKKLFKRNNILPKKKIKFKLKGK